MNQLAKFGYFKRARASRGPCRGKIKDGISTHGFLSKNFPPSNAQPQGPNEKYKMER